MFFLNLLYKNGYSYLNALGRFGETSQTAVTKNNSSLWMGFFHCIEDGSEPEASLENTKEKSSIGCSYPKWSFHILILSPEFLALLAHDAGHLWT